jgi:hypothetical protein
MDFIMGFPKNQSCHDSIYVVMDQLIKHDPFLLVKPTMSTVNVARLFIQEIFQLHSLPKEFVILVLEYLTRNV